MRKKTILITIIVLGFLVSCTPQQTTDTKPEENQEQGEQIVEASTTEIPDTAEETSPPETESPQPPLDSPLEPKILSDGDMLESSGPWLMMSTDAGFWFIDQEADETGFLPIPPSFTSAYAVPAPQGGLLAIVYSNYVNNEKQLEIYSLVENKTLYSLDLLGYQGDELAFENEREKDDFALDRFQAVGRREWSSDGSQLAFVSSHLGPSPDVYTYDVDTGLVQQLTFGPSHAVGLNWSPDDEYIFHAGVDKMYVDYSGSGYSGWVFYAARADGSGIITVGEGAHDQAGEVVVGWLSDNQALMESHYGYCGLFDLRAVNIETGANETFWPGQYDSFIFDPGSQTGLLWVSPEPLVSDDCGPKEESGLYLLSFSDGGREKIQDLGEGFYLTLSWSNNATRFIIKVNDQTFKTESWNTITTDGEIESFIGEPVYSPDGGAYAVLGPTSESLQVKGLDGSPRILIQVGEVLHPQWAVDGSGLFFLYRGHSDDRFDLYYWAVSTNLISKLVLEDFFKLYDDEPVWIMP
jgi:hypothetical protein